jgi:hypothetical protein
MYRTLQYFKNIKFNPLVIKTLANEGKKKSNLINIKNYQHTIIRKFGTKTTSNSFNTRDFNQPPEPPSWMFAVAVISGIYFSFQKRY